MNLSETQETSQETLELNNEALSKSPEQTLETTETSSEEKDQVGSDSSQESTETETFYNAQTVPPELKSTYISMQNAFSKRMQEASEAKKQVDQVSEKSKLYDQIMENPSVRQALGIEQPEKTIEEKYQGKTAHEIVEAMIQEKLDQRFKSDIEPVISKSMQKEADAEIADLEKKFPEGGDLPSFASLRNDIADRVEKYPEIPLEEHYKVLAFEQAQTAGKQQAYRSQEEKKKSSAETAGVPEAVTDEKPNVETFWDAVKYAKRKLAKAR